MLKCLLKANECYLVNQRIKPKGVMVHSTGANNPNLKRYVQPLNNQNLLKKIGINVTGNHWNRFRPDNRQVCVHAFIGKLADGTVETIQTLPWDCRGWHSGVGTTGHTANDTHIGFEICEDNLTDERYFKQTYNAAAELVAMLCKQYGLDPTKDGVVICHQDGYKRGIASNHGDIYNWWPKFGYSMDDFRAEAVKKMNEEEDDMTYYATLADVPEWYKSAVDKAIKANALRGHEDGKLDISEDLCRTLTILDRMGKLD